MAFSLTNDCKQSLMTITQLPQQNLEKLCTQLSDYLNNEMSENFTHPQDLATTATILHFFLECTKQKLNSDEFKECITTLGFDEPKSNTLKKLYDNSAESLKQVFILRRPNLNYYVDLFWRFEVQVASRYLKQQCMPVITLTLQISKGESLRLKNEPKNDEEQSLFKKKEILMQTDVNNLCKMIQVLEKALQEGKSQRVHNITHALG
ncbi:COMM domain-containing protein 2-like [Ctenocephalides felis]|uniref:COMM domain-containing protein 2-like n=1 Tax=Ctenocephalides felis TaxID=7515 RepID=UPI000E6E55FB|nr:COMM domain-containing protein 2-like [Ctenocephalides felis]